MLGFCLCNGSPPAQAPFCFHVQVEDLSEGAAQMHHIAQQRDQRVLLSSVP